MEELANLLMQENASLAVRSSNGNISLYYGRGVSDLYRLLNEKPEVIAGAEVADKVVGKGAAALMIKAGVKRLHAVLISEPALHLCQLYELPLTYGQLVPSIINRDKSGPCPVEALCGSETDIDKLYASISSFVERISSKPTGNN